MSSILSWNIFWVAAGIIADIIALAFAYKLGHTAGECAAVDEVNDLYTTNRKLRRELDFLQAEKDNLQKLINRQIERAHWKDRLHSHLGGRRPMTATETEMLMNAAMIKDSPPGVVEDRLTQPPVVTSGLVLPDKNQRE